MASLVAEGWAVDASDPSSSALGKPALGTLPNSCNERTRVVPRLLSTQEVPSGFLHRTAMSGVACI